MLKTVVLGAKANPARYSYKCVKSLIKHGFEAVPVGKITGKIEEVDILTGQPDIKDVHTISIYLNEESQKEYYEYIFKLNPERIIFNPGTHNQELIDMVKEKGIEVISDCALIMLSSEMY